MIRQTVLPFKLEMTNDLITSHAGLVLLGEFAVSEIPIYHEPLSRYHGEDDIIRIAFIIDAELRLRGRIPD